MNFLTGIAFIMAVGIAGYGSFKDEGKAYPGSGLVVFGEFQEIDASAFEKQGLDKPVGRIDKPVGRIDKPVGRIDKPVGRIDKPVGRIGKTAGTLGTIGY